MKDAIIVAIVVIFILLATTIYINIINNKVLSSSKKIASLLALNKEIFFNQITDRFEVSKHYTNKWNYNKIAPSYIMTAHVKENISFFSDYIQKIKENQIKKTQYQNSIQEILSADNVVDYAELRMSEKIYKKLEKRLFSKRVLHPVVSCFFTVTMSYSSPKGKVNLSKNNTFTFNDLFACFESVSRTYLDARTRHQLATVERGEISDSMRYDILCRDNFSCVICGASAQQGARLHVDHIIPISKGGKSIHSNLRTLCERCNVGKSNKIEVSSSQSANSDTTNILICEKCGAPLILRKGKYSDFYGCSNYPYCHFTKKL